MSLPLKIILRTTAFGAIFYGSVVGFFWAMQDRFIFPGAFGGLPDWVASIRSTDVSPTFIETENDVSLYALYRAPNPGMPTIIVFHGNAGFPEDFSIFYKSWANSGYGIVSPAYRGFPRSSGMVSADGILRDALAVYDWAKSENPGSEIVTLGQSLGTASALTVSGNRKVKGTVLVSPFKSMISLVSSKYPYLPVSYILRSQLRNDLEIVKTKSPIIIFHGDTDNLVPIKSGLELANLAPTPPVFITVKGAGHVKGLFKLAMIRQINDFIGKLN